jgi:thiosulfate dehydrogenase [quinone] large subunit
MQLETKQYTALAMLRFFIGWHFLYEGVIKLFNPNWTAAGYMMSAEGFAKPFFQWLGRDTLIGTIDFLNILCLVFVGLALVIGFWEKLAAVAGIGLLVLYYLAHPAFPGLDQVGTEGSYYIINKNLIEAAALYVIYLFPTGQYFGIKRLIKPSSVHALSSN